MNSILSLNELAEYLRISKSTLYQLSAVGKIPSFKVGKQLRFRRNSIDGWIARKEKLKARRIKEKLKKMKKGESLDGHD